MFTLPTGPHHRLVRRAVAPAFSTENLKCGCGRNPDLPSRLYKNHRAMSLSWHWELTTYQLEWQPNSLNRSQG